MSLTDKEKETAIKIAHAMPQGFLWWGDCGWETGVLEEEIKEFADLFLSRLREEQPADPCDCEELVEALERILKWVAPIAGDNSDRRAAAEEEMSMTCAIAALTNHAKRVKLTKATLGEE